MISINITNNFDRSCLCFYFMATCWISALKLKLALQLTARVMANPFSIDTLSKHKWSVPWSVLLRITLNMSISLEKQGEKSSRICSTAIGIGDFTDSRCVTIEGWWCKIRGAMKSHVTSTWWNWPRRFELTNRKHFNSRSMPLIFILQKSTRCRPLCVKTLNINFMVEIHWCRHVVRTFSSSSTSTNLHKSSIDWNIDDVVNIVFEDPVRIEPWMPPTFVSQSVFIIAANILRADDNFAYCIHWQVVYTRPHRTRKCCILIFVCRRLLPAYFHHQLDNIYITFASGMFLAREKQYNN